jgi:ADP-ribosyl-[dinitrogen reductase] hydrolase
MIDQNKKEQLKSAVYGFAVGDAVGVPYEFKSRSEMDVLSATDMVGYGAHYQPAGTWSDDTSLLLCVLENLLEQGSATDLADKFLIWYEKAAYTATNEVFDVGITVAMALDRISQGTEPEFAGATDEWSAGNGSLMRSLPYAFITDLEVAEDKIYTENTITHGLDICNEASMFYVAALRYLIDGGNKETLISAVISLLATYKTKRQFGFEELKAKTRLFQDNFKELQRSEIRSGGYVAETIEASIWCFLTTDSYKDAVLKAVNLGQDTDTVAALTGGLAGIYYGLNGVPEKWLMELKGKELIDMILYNS